MRSALLAVVLLTAAPALASGAMESMPSVLPAPPGPGADLPSPLRGRPLTEVLQSLRAAGLNVVFTSELVRPDMTVLDEPAAEDPRRLLDEILAPHALAVRETAPGVLVVVRGAGGAITGRVVVEDAGRPLAGATVRATRNAPQASVPTGDGEPREAITAADGTFSLATLPAGDYAVEAHAAGYLPRRLDSLAVTAGPPHDVTFHLHPLPFVDDAIVVRPSRLSVLRRRPDAVFSLDRDEIDSLPHLGGDVFRAFSLFPGVAANDVTAQLSVHGGRRDEVKVVLDGQELYDAHHLKDYDNALSVVPARSLAGASLTTGAFPASQGDRMSGVLELSTLEPTPRPQWLLGAGVFDLLAQSRGSFQRRRADGGDAKGGAEGRPTGGWLFAARRGSLDLAGAAIGDEDPFFWDALGKVEWELGSNASGDGGGPSVVSAHFLTAGDGLALDRREDEDRERLDNAYRSTYAWLTHRTAPSRRLLVETSVSYAEVRRRRDAFASEEDGRYDLRDHRHLEVLGAAQSWDFEIAPRHLLRWGWEARRYEAFFDYARQQERGFVVLPPSGEAIPLDSDFRGTLRGDYGAAWVSDRLTLFDRLTAEAGLRWDRPTATDESLWSPRLNLAWRLGEASVVRAGWGRFLQSQRPYELAVEDGDRSLAPAERSQHWVLGVESLLPRRTLGLDAVRLELYRRYVADPRVRYENLLEPFNFIPAIEPDRVRVTPQETTSQGVELLLRGGAGDAVSWWLAYGYAKAEDRVGGRTVPRPLDQRHTLSLSLDAHLPHGWRLDLAWRYRTGWPTTPLSAVELPAGEAPDEADEGENGDGDVTELSVAFGPLYSRRLPAYHRLDLRASRRWALAAGRGHLTVYLDVQNVYDRRNPSGFDLQVDDEEGVELIVERWPGIFPSLGVVWEF